MNAPTRRLIHSRGEFHEALRSAFAQAAQAQAREIALCDPDFADWPLGEPGVVADLQRWVRARSRLTLYAHSFDAIAQRCGRWIAWRRQWSHAVDCRTNGELEAADYPSLCLVPGVVSIRLLDPVLPRGIASYEAVDELACREAVDAVSQRSVESFPVTTLGI